MRLTSIMSEELVLPDVRSTAKEGLLSEVVDCLAESKPEIDREEALRVLLARERLGSTAVGRGFAVPHAKLRSLDGMVACFARSSDGVDFASLDGQPAHLFLALLAPEGAAGLHLKALARASRLFKNATLREQLMVESSRVGLWEIIRNADESLTLDGQSSRA
jgi:PTS system nitrogen regulatory IIA component